MKINSHEEAFQAIKVSSIAFFCVGSVQLLFSLFGGTQFIIEGGVLILFAIFLYYKKSLVAATGLLVISIMVLIFISKMITNIAIAILMIYLSINAIRSTIFLRKEKTNLG